MGMKKRNGSSQTRLPEDRLIPEWGDSIERPNGKRTTTAYWLRTVHQGTVRYNANLYQRGSVVETLTLQ